MAEERLINGKPYTVRLELTRNRRATAFVEDSTICIRLPSRWPKSEAYRASLQLEKRIIRSLEKNPEAVKRLKPVSFLEGQEIKILGKRFLLTKTAARGRTASARLDGETVIVRLPPNPDKGSESEVFSNLARRVISGAIHDELEARVRTLNDTHFHNTLSKVFIKDNLTNFGSCSSKKNINISFRLLFAPPDVLDYVIIHELAHLKEHNHSAAFWGLVEGAMPRYKEQDRWLKENRAAIVPDIKVGPTI